MPGVAQRGGLGVSLVLCLPHVRIADDVEAFGVGRHHAVLDAVVHHLHEMPRVLSDEIDRLILPFAHQRYLLDTIPGVNKRSAKEPDHLPAPGCGCFTSADPPAARRFTFVGRITKGLFWRNFSDFARIKQLPARLVRQPRLALALAVAVGFALAFPRVWTTLHEHAGHRLLDLEVYRNAGVAVLGGRDVYAVTPPVLPFTYTPAAALLAVPLALVSLGTLHIAWTLGGLALLAVLVAASFRTRNPVRAVLLAALALQLRPVSDELRFGQIGFLLAALVFADCLPQHTRWPRGVLTGLAAAIKLTPAVFIPYLWLSGRRRAALVATATFAGLSLLSFLVVPKTSADFWFGALGRSDRLGDNMNWSNQALRGITLRAGVPTTVWLVLAAILGAVGLWRASRASRSGDERTGLAIIGLLAVLLSPVAWMHHMMWIVLVLGVLVYQRRYWLAVGLWGFFVLPLPWYGRDLAELGIPGAQVVGDAYGLMAVALVLLLPVSAGRVGAELPRVPRTRRAPISPDGPVPAPPEQRPPTQLRHRLDPGPVPAAHPSSP